MQEKKRKKTDSFFNFIVVHLTLMNYFEEEEEKKAVAWIVKWELVLVLLGFVIMSLSMYGCLDGFFVGIVKPAQSHHGWVLKWALAYALTNKQTNKYKHTHSHLFR